MECMTEDPTEEKPHLFKTFSETLPFINAR